VSDRVLDEEGATREPLVDTARVREWRDRVEHVVRDEELPTQFLRTNRTLEALCSAYFPRDALNLDAGHDVANVFGGLGRVADPTPSFIERSLAEIRPVRTCDGIEGLVGREPRSQTGGGVVRAKPKQGGRITRLDRSENRRKIGERGAGHVQTCAEECLDRVEGDNAKAVGVGVDRNGTCFESSEYIVHPLLGLLGRILCDGADSLASLRAEVEESADDFVGILHVAGDVASMPQRGVDDSVDMHQADLVRI